MIEVKSYRRRAVTGKYVEEKVHTVLVSDHGRKYLHVLMCDGGLTLRKVSTSEEKFMTDVIQNGKQKSLKTVIRQFRGYGNRVGMTKAAKAFLTKANKAA